MHESRRGIPTIRSTSLTLRACPCRALGAVVEMAIGFPLLNSSDVKLVETDVYLARWTLKDGFLFNKTEFQESLGVRQRYIEQRAKGDANHNTEAALGKAAKAERIVKDALEEATGEKETAEAAFVEAAEANHSPSTKRDTDSALLGATKVKCNDQDALLQKSEAKRLAEVALLAAAKEEVGASTGLPEIE